jgi:hypothetical protein
MQMMAAAREIKLVEACSDGAFMPRVVACARCGPAPMSRLNGGRCHANPTGEATLELIDELKARAD